MEIREIQAIVESLLFAAGEAVELEKDCRYSGC